MPTEPSFSETERSPETPSAAKLPSMPLTSSPAPAAPPHAPPVTSSAPALTPSPGPAEAGSAKPPSRGRQAPPRRVDHTYRDYSHVTTGEDLPRKKSAANFPSKLHRILSTPEFAHVSCPRRPSSRPSRCRLRLTPASHAYLPFSAATAPLDADHLLDGERFVTGCHRCCCPRACSPPHVTARLHRSPPASPLPGPGSPTAGRGRSTTRSAWWRR